MSTSPVLRRFSNYSSPGSMSFGMGMAGSFSPSQSQEEVLQAYEAEEERIVNALSRKLEQLREDKINLENALEQESESHVNRLTRELSALRLLQLNQNQGVSGNGTPSISPAIPVPRLSDPRFPSSEAMLDAIRRENEALRSRLAEAETNYVRVSRLNDIYREELIEHRRRLGVPVDNLIGLHSPISESTHRRRPPATNGLPIPQSSSQVHRPPHLQNIHRPAPVSSSSTSLSTSSLSSSLPTSPTPFPFSPPSPLNTMASHAEGTSYSTGVTTPPSSAILVLNGNPGTVTLSYPHVPPPSLSSSLGSPVAFFGGGASTAPSRRNSVRIAETGSLVRNRSSAAGPSIEAIHRNVSRSPVTDLRASPNRSRHSPTLLPGTMAEEDLDLPPL